MAFPRISLLCLLTAGLTPCIMRAKIAPGTLDQPAIEVTAYRVPTSLQDATQDITLITRSLWLDLSSLIGSASGSSSLDPVGGDSGHCRNSGIRRLLEDRYLTSAVSRACSFNTPHRTSRNGSVLP